MHPDAHKDALAILHLRILIHMAENTPHDFIGEWAFNFRAFTGDGMSRDLVRVLCRDMTDMGLCFYMRGMMSEEGEPMGAGYGITRKGLELIQPALD